MHPDDDPIKLLLFIEQNRDDLVRVRDLPPASAEKAQLHAELVQRRKDMGLETYIISIIHMMPL